MKSAVFEKCKGEAHSIGYIDHCGLCMPFWENIPLCPDCKDKGKRTVLSTTGFCEVCRKHYALEEHNDN